MYKVGVIGLGSIAATYANPEKPYPYAHVGGIRQSDQVELTAAADLSEEARNTFNDTWGPVFPNTKVYDDTAAMLANEDLDIIAVCVRGPHHLAVTKQVLEAGPRAIFLEKPPTCSLAEMDELVAAAKQKNIPITASYSRHWVPHILHMEKLIKDGLIGEVRTVVGYCGGAFLSFASHTTDLICQFAGYCPTGVFARGKPGTDTVDGYEPEPAVDVMVIELANGITAVQLAEGEHGGMYCDVIGSEGRARVGMYIPPYAENKDGEIDLAAIGMPENASVFKVAYEQIAQHLDGGPLPACTGDQWTTIHELGLAGIESVLTGQHIALPCNNRARKIFANG